MRPVFFSIFALLALSACQPAAPAAPIAISEASAGASPDGVDMAAGYLSVSNSGAEDYLISAASPRASEVSLHTMQVDGMVMRMRATERMIVPAHGELNLTPGGDHLMFTGLTAPFADGEEIPVTLTFEHAGAIEVTLPVHGGGTHSDH